MKGSFKKESIEKLRFEVDGGWGNIIYFIKKQLNLLCFVALCVIAFAMPVFAVEDGSIEGLWNPLLPLQNQPKKEF